MAGMKKAFSLVSLLALGSCVLVGPRSERVLDFQDEAVIVPRYDADVHLVHSGPGEIQGSVVYREGAAPDLFTLLPGQAWDGDLRAGARLVLQHPAPGRAPIAMTALGKGSLAFDILLDGKP